MTVSSINLKISNNPGRSTVAGKGSGGRGKRAAAEKSAGTAASRARAGTSYAAALSAPAPNVTPVKQAKRQDQKATPTSHATTKATEMAGRKKSTATRGTDPISLLSSGPGGGSQAPTLVDRKTRTTWLRTRIHRYHWTELWTRTDPRQAEVASTRRR